MIRTTIIGGALFLLPLVVITYVLGRAFDIAKIIAAPVDRIIPIERFAGVALVNILAIILILLVCYFAGVLARRPAVQRKVTALDEAMVRIIPAYAMVKTMISSIGRMEEETDSMRAVLVQLDDTASIAFEVERNDTHVVVYMPGSPSPWSGSTAVVEFSRVTPLNIPSHQAAKLLQLLGRGSLGALNQAPQDPAADRT